jgi:peptidyl-prolyl cis-trans isomerase-like 4
MAVLLETSKGDMVVDLLVDECPRASTNFLKLCKYVGAFCLPAAFRLLIGYDVARSDRDCSCRIKYYNNVLFHNVQHNFIAQTGDPDGTGNGGMSAFG